MRSTLLEMQAEALALAEVVGCFSRKLFVIRYPRRNLKSSMAHSRRT